MDDLNEISDEEFIPFLNDLGVDTYKKSFEWMLNDPDFSDVLRWIYSSVDENNALTAREEYRYAEIVKRGNILNNQELEKNIASLQEKYPGICLAGDRTYMEDVKYDIKVQNERLDMLQKHEEMFKDLIKQNELVNEELNVEIAKLNAAIQQSVEDETASKDECMKLAEQMNSVTNDVINDIAEVLNLYESCNTDKDVAKKLFTFGPISEYHQYQSMLLTVYDQLIYQLVAKSQTEHVTVQNLQNAYAKAQLLEERFSEVCDTYIDTKASLCGERAKLPVIRNFKNYHPSQVAISILEARNQCGMLDMENSQVEDEVLTQAVKRYVDRRTALTMDVSTRAWVLVREDMMRDLNCIVETLREALLLDRVLYSALRCELGGTQKVLHFANEMCHYLTKNDIAVQSRIKSMKNICIEMDAAEQSNLFSGKVLDILSNILGGTSDRSPGTLVKLHRELQCETRDLVDHISEQMTSKEQRLDEVKKWCKRLEQLMYDGCTRRPNCHNRGVASAAHALRLAMERADAKVVETSALFNTVKNGNQQHLRRLWQWFLTDPPRLLAAVRQTQRS